MIWELTKAVIIGIFFGAIGGVVGSFAIFIFQDGWLRTMKNLGLIKEE